MKTHTSLLRLALASTLLASVGALRAEDKEKSDVVPPSVLKKYDKNQDGALDEKERGKWEADKAARREKERAQRAEMLEKYDSNKDGKLSEEERAAAKLGMERTRTEKEGEKMKERAAKQEKEEREAARKEAEKAREKAKEEGAKKEEKEKEKPKPGAGMDDGEAMMMN